MKVILEEDTKENVDELLLGKYRLAFKYDGKIYKILVPNTQAFTIVLIIKEHFKPDSIVYTNTYRHYDVIDVNVYTH